MNMMASGHDRPLLFPAQSPPQTCDPLQHPRSAPSTLPACHPPVKRTCTHFPEAHGKVVTHVHFHTVAFPHGSTPGVQHVSISAYRQVSMSARQHVSTPAVRWNQVEFRKKWAGRSGQEEVGRKRWAGRGGSEEVGRKRWAGRGGQEEDPNRSQTMPWRAWRTRRTRRTRLKPNRCRFL